MENTTTVAIPRVLAIEVAARRISANGHGATDEWTTELIDAANSGAIPIHDFLNDESEPWITSTVKTADVQKYLSAQHGFDLLTICATLEPLPADLPVVDTAPAPTETTAETLGTVGGVETDKAGPVVKVPVQGNSTKPPRSDSIDPVIKLAQTKCSDPKNTNEVWPQMQVLAQNEHPPFLASMPEGLKYHKGGKDAYFTRDALNKRLHPEKRKAPAKRR